MAAGTALVDDRDSLTYDGAGHSQAGNRSGKNLHFGIRAHGMAAIVNGLPRIANLEHLRSTSGVHAGVRLLPHTITATFRLAVFRILDIGT